MNNPEKELDERDWFAAHAPFETMGFVHGSSTNTTDVNILADAAYKYAEAMMKRRLQRPASKAADVINSIIDSAPKNQAPIRQGSRNTFA